MKKRLRWKIILILAIIGLALVLSYPPGKKINLGLDLQGGMHLVLQVITDDAINAEINQAILRLQEQLKKKNIGYGTISKGKIGHFSVQGINPSQEAQTKEILDEFFGSNWDYTIIGNTLSLSLKSGVIMHYREQSVRMSLETIRNRVDEFGLAEIPIQRQGGYGGDRIIVELPGVENPERVKNIIKTTAFLEWKLVYAGPASDEETLLKEFEGKLPEDKEILKADPSSSEKGYYLVDRVAPITGKDLRNARRSVDQWGNPAVAFMLNSDGAKRFYKFTSENIGKLLAVVLDNRIYEVATIESRISDSGIIRGTFTVEAADDLSMVLRAGALPASIKYLEDRTIGPSLGADSVRKGLSAIIAAFILVILFMVLYYRKSGFNAVAALILNILILMGALSYFKAALTLPGIAGIILTIGMAVDANVLIFERIREELSTGKGILNSIASGFARAFRTILDANVTTIIAAIFLFQFGTGPIRGFAITLIIGITASMFTAVFVSRVIFDVGSTRKKREKLSI
jgi:preprotein translocase subunit SecD